MLEFRVCVKQDCTLSHGNAEFGYELMTVIQVVTLMAKIKFQKPAPIEGMLGR